MVIGDAVPAGLGNGHLCKKHAGRNPKGALVHEFPARHTIRTYRFFVYKYSMSFSHITNVNESVKMRNPFEHYCYTDLAE